MLVIYSATRQNIKIEGNKEKKNLSGGRNMGGTKIITGKYEIECPVFTFHYI
jgi:hypothetical protein